MRVLVTGAGGFLGQHIMAKLIRAGYQVTALSRRHLGEYNAGLVVDLSEPLKASIVKDFDIIIHLAGTVNVSDMLKEPAKNIMNNVGCTLNLLEDVRLNNPQCLFVYMSSDRVYGLQASGTANEDSVCVPSDPYSASKLISEELVRGYHGAYGIGFLIFRAGNTFGPGQPEGLFIPSVIAKIVSGTDEIRVGNLDAYRNFLYVEDLAEAVLLCLKKGIMNQILNLSAYNYRISDVLDVIVREASSMTGRKLKIVQDPLLFRKNEKDSRVLLDCAKIRSYGWKPKKEFSQAIRTTLSAALGIDSSADVLLDK